MDKISNIFAACEKSGKKVSVCESLTGGLIISTLIGREGASKYVHEGVVAYADESKTLRLGVKEETLKKFGAVSAEVAAEMAEGLYKSGDAGFTVSTTGIAGPSGGSVEKPVGLTYIGIHDGVETRVYKYLFEGDRHEIRERATDKALKLLEEALVHSQV